MEIYLKHPMVVWSIFAPIALVAIVGTLIFLVISLLPSSKVEELVSRYTRTIRSLKDDRTWANVKATIESECRTSPVDLVVIDYLSLLNDPHARDAVQAMTRIVQDAKQVAMRSNNGKGLCLLTPVQGNRAGYAAAQASDGAWETSGISQYSELDKSLDNCLYVYTTDDISGEGQLKIGSCKARNGENMPSTFVGINKLAGMVWSSQGSKQLEPSDRKVLPRITSREEIMSYLEPR
jgi:hypothetical protein